MIQALKLLPLFQKTVCDVLQALPSPPATIDDVVAFVGAIHRKGRFACMHKRILDGINWEGIDRLGRTLDGGVDPESLKLELEDASLHLRHPGAVTDHVYLAFDGVTAAVVNMTDTFARLVNVVYGLKIPVRQASIRAVRDRCAKTSCLGIVLHDPRNIEWLSKLKDLRGRCQHADIEQVLVLQNSSYAARGEPCVRREYWWNAPLVDVPVVTFASAAVSESERLMCACIASLAGSPTDPTK